MPVVLLASLSMGGCGGGDRELVVDLVTDYRPGIDFDRVGIQLGRADGSDVQRQTRDAVTSGYLEAKRIAQFSGVGRGRHVLTVTLLSNGGSAVASRRVRREVQDDALVKVVITSDCAGVECPDAGEADATECLGGRCVPPECATGGEPECPEAQCEVDGDCEVTAPCAEPICEEGVCLSAPNDARCDTGEVCDVREGCRVARMDDGGTPDGGAPDGGGSDAGPSCTPASCDDGIACTADSCAADGSCEHAPDDTACTDGPEGRCDPDLGCQYATCTPESCTPDSDCQTATCEGDTCVRESTCTSGETCCAGSCVPAGCDDGIACTTDVCGSTGCEHLPDDTACGDGNPCTDDGCNPSSGCESTNNSASCDDGTFCNGADTCAGGSCSGHAGDPCTGSTVCDEGADSCVGCVDDGDCPADEVGTWSTCSYSGTCDESGLQSRTVTSYACVGGSCVPSEDTEMQGCARDTDGTSCGSTGCDDWSSCGGFGSTCAESGTQSRDCTDRECVSGTCSDVTRTETRGCTRDTDGTTCGTTSCGSCGGFSSTCDETGTETCTDYVCSSGTCSASERGQPCSRDTDGQQCGAAFGCLAPDFCSGGTCVDGGDTCTGTQRCCVDLCVCEGCSCP